MKKTFISHSGFDKIIVKELAHKLKNENVWFDLWDMESGDVLSEKIETGIDEAKIFLLILSNNSINSNWVKYELNMAIIKYLENEDYRIVVARIDKVEVPLRLKPFLRIDCEKSINIVEDIYENITSTNDTTQKSFKRQFINRSAEITSLQDMLYDPMTRFISVIGFFGIGKSSLLKEALKRIYSNSNIVEINLSRAFIGSRLTLELCSKANLSIPLDGASKEELDKMNLMAIETLLSKQNFIVFNKIESILDDEGQPNEDFKSILEYFQDKEILNKTPFFLLSTRWLSFDFINKTNFETLKVDGVSSKHLSHIINSEIERTDPNAIIDTDSIEKISGYLHGYPLAGRLAASIIVKYGSKYLIDNIHVINKLKIDIAEDIISQAKLTDCEIEILELLAIYEHPLKPTYINEVINIEIDDFNRCIDNLVSFNLLETNGEALLLHPLVNDFYLKLARNSPNFIPFADKLSLIAKKVLNITESTDRNYVYWLTNTCRMLFYCGKHEESRKLRRDLIGELKDAAIKLYQRQDYSNSLLFCNDFLESKPDDKDVLFTKARCLSRIGKISESKNILENLIKHENNINRIAKYNYAIGRAYIENSQKNEDEYLENAEKYFMESIRLNEHATALQSMGELLFRKNKYEEAASFIERKLVDSPTDPYALSIYADILWAMGKKGDAIGKIMEVLKQQPRNPNFLFRAGRFLLESNEVLEAYKFFKQAVNLDDSYFDARLSLANACLDLDYLAESKQHIDFLNTKIKGDKQNILESIRANYYIKIDQIEKAEDIAQKLVRLNKNEANLGLLAKVYIYKSRISSKKGFTLIAESDKNRAKDLINEGLKIDVNNERLKAMLKSIG
jgi:Archaeal ATPase./TIR domain.